MASVSTLQPVSARGWRSGLANLLDREFHVWWGTRFGLLQLVMWIVIINGLMAIIISTVGEEAEAGADALYSTLEPFVGVTAWFTVVGATILAQGAIVGEKRSGTAAWILSAPVSRSALLLSKLAALGLGCMITMIVVPGVIAYLEFSFLPMTADASLAFVPFFAGVGTLALLVMFYVSLTVALGTVFSNRGPVIGIAMAVFLGSLILPGWLPSWLADLTPWPIGNVAIELVRAEALTSAIPIIATAVWTVVLMAVGIWRFQREEF